VARGGETDQSAQPTASAQKKTSEGGEKQVNSLTMAFLLEVKRIFIPYGFGGKRRDERTSAKG